MAHDTDDRDAGSDIGSGSASIPRATPTPAEPSGDQPEPPDSDRALTVCA